MTPAQIQETIALLDAGLDVALPVLGQPELVPIADAVAALGKKIAEALEAKAAQQSPVAAEVGAADAAADAAEAAKFPVKP